MSKSTVVKRAAAVGLAGAFVLSLTSASIAQSRFGHHHSGGAARAAIAGAARAIQAAPRVAPQGNWAAHRGAHWAGQHHRHHHRGNIGAFAAGAAIGAIGTAAAISAAQPRYYSTYDRPYAYEPAPAYEYYGEEPVEAEGPVYASPTPVPAPNPGARCFIYTDRDKGHGYWGWC